MMTTQNMFSPLGFYLDYFTWHNLYINFVFDWNIFTSTITISEETERPRLHIFAYLKDVQTLIWEILTVSPEDLINTLSSTCPSFSIMPNFKRSTHSYNKSGFRIRFTIFIAFVFTYIYAPKLHCCFFMILMKWIFLEVSIVLF